MAGYQVLVDGAPVTAVGGTTVVLRFAPDGGHTYGVRTINAVDQLSAIAVAG